MNRKFWLKSKTMICNSLFLALAALPQVMPTIQEMSNGWYVGLTIAMPVLNMWLRSITHEPVTFKRGE